MKVKGNISILVGREYTSIEVRDSNAATQFLRIKLSPEQLSQVLSRQAEVPCELEITGIDKIGKQHENKKFTFELPEHLREYDVKCEKLAEHAQSLLKDGWIADKYFRSQDSFFTLDGKKHARCVIGRWY